MIPDQIREYYDRHLNMTLRELSAMTGRTIPELKEILIDRMKTFKNVAIGEKFYFAGGVWIKKSSRTAWVANKTQYFYFGKNEEVTT